MHTLIIGVVLTSTAMIKQLNSVNLLKDQEKTMFGKFLDWSLSVGRFLIIATETVALLMFLYRFTLDRTLIDLHDEIKKKQEVVSHLEENEKLYRNLQQRLAIIKRHEPQSKETDSTIKEVINIARGKMLFTSLSFTDNKISIDGTAPSVQGINNFVTAIRGYDKIKQVSLDKIENKTSEGIVAAGISLSLVGEEPLANTTSDEPIVDNPDANGDSAAQDTPVE